MGKELQTSMISWFHRETCSQKSVVTYFKLTCKKYFRNGFSHLSGWLRGANDLTVRSYVFPRGDDGVSWCKLSVWEPFLDLSSYSIQDTREFSLPVIDGSFSVTGVYVSEEGGDDWEFGGETVINVLLLHGKVMRRDDAIGGHLEWQCTISSLLHSPSIFFALNKNILTSLFLSSLVTVPSYSRWPN